MGSYGTMTNLATGDLVSETEMDTIRGNIEYLLDPNHSVILRDNAANYTNTSTAWADVDATNLAVTLTTYGGPVLVTINVLLYSATSQYVYLELDVDGSGYSGHSNGVWWGYCPTGQWVPATMTLLNTGLSAGSHTFKLQWKGQYTYNRSLAAAAASHYANLAAIEL